ncbi:hypothetical protein [Actinocorallia herbida]|nr:hypothetical protein [Actinocorallia herbida]
MVDPLSAAERAADFAEKMLATPYRLPRPIVEYPPGAGPVERREEMRPVYAAIVERIGPPTLLGATGDGPYVRWGRRGDTLLLTGDRAAATLVSVDTREFLRKEYDALQRNYGTPSPQRPPYLWRLDRKGPGPVTRYYEYAGHLNGRVGWEEFGEALERVLSSFVEHMPVQAGECWVAFRLRAEGRDVLLNYDLRDHGAELCAIVEDRGTDDEDVMRARGWRSVDRYGRWRIDLPEADPGSAAEIARVVVAELRTRVRDPRSLMAHDVGAGDDGDLWLPGLGIEVWPRREAGDDH